MPEPPETSLVEADDLTASTRSTDAFVFTPSRAAQRVVVAVGLVAGACLGAVAITSSPSIGIGLLLVAAVATLGAIGARDRGWLSVRAHHAVAFDEAGLHIAGRLLLPATEIRSLWVLRSPSQGGRIVVRRAWHKSPILVDVASVASAWSLVDNLPYGPLMGASAYRVTPVHLSFLNALVCPSLIFVISHHSSNNADLWVMALCIAAALLWNYLLWARVVVGTDGVAYQRWRRCRFMSFRTVRSIERHSSRIQVEFQEGPSVQIENWNCGQSEALFELLTLRLERYRSRASSEVVAVPSSSGTHPYHVHADRLPRLRELVENPSYEPETRVRAALALRRESPEGVSIIRAAAANTASSSLRAALASTAQLDDATCKAIPPDDMKVGA